MVSNRQRTANRSFVSIDHRSRFHADTTDWGPRFTPAATATKPNRLASLRALYAGADDGADVAMSPVLIMPQPAPDSACLPLASSPDKNVSHVVSAAAVMCLENDPFGKRQRKERNHH